MLEALLLKIDGLIISVLEEGISWEMVSFIIMFQLNRDVDYALAAQSGQIQLSFRSFQLFINS